LCFGSFFGSCRFFLCLVAASSRCFCWSRGFLLDWFCNVELHWLRSVFVSVDAFYVACAVNLLRFSAVLEVCCVSVVLVV